jgi:hypothetical protein
MKYIPISILAGICLFMTGCYSTRIISTKSNSSHEVKYSSLKKILVASFLLNDTRRIKSENEIVHFLKGKGIASHTLFSKNLDIKNESFQRILEEQKFDGAILLRLIDIDREVYVRLGAPFSSYPNYYQNFNGLFYRSWEIYSMPDHSINMKTFTVEITLFSIPQDKIIWTAITESVSPSSIEQMTKEIAKVVYKKTKKRRTLD